MHDILINPGYAGAHVVGRTTSEVSVDEGGYGNHLISVIAVKEPIDGRHADLADFCGSCASPFLFRPLMRTRRPVG